jgi:hypothetical protein
VHIAKIYMFKKEKHHMQPHDKMGTFNSAGFKFSLTYALNE